MNTYAATVQNEPIKKRAACDRCHSQKLRCLKRAGTEGCVRCHKARATCMFSPPVRKFRLPETSAMPVEVSATYMPDLSLSAVGPSYSNQAFDWETYDTDAILNGLLDPTVDTMNVNWSSEMLVVNETADSGLHEAGKMRPNSSDSTASPSTNTSSEKVHNIGEAIPTQLSPPEAVLRDLSQVSEKLYTHSINFPRRSPSSSPASYTLHVNATPEETKYFDDTLMLTNSLIEIYPKFIADVLHLSPNPYRSQDLGIITPSIVSGRPAPKKVPQLDYSSILQINACHQRLAGCWDDTLEQMESCTNHMLQDMLKEGAEPSLDHIPVVQIGNYTPSKSQVMLMQQTLLLQLLTQLWEKSNDLVVAVQQYLVIQKGIEGSIASDSIAQLTESICIETQKRANANITKLRTLKGTWEDQGLVYGTKS